MDGEVIDCSPPPRHRPGQRTSLSPAALEAADRIAAEAPPLTPSQQDLLRALFGPGLEKIRAERLRRAA